MGDLFSRFAKIIASNFYDALQPLSVDSSPLILERVTPQWVNSPADLVLPDSDHIHMTLTHHLQEESLALSSGYKILTSPNPLHVTHASNYSCPTAFSSITSALSTYHTSVQL